MKKILVIAILMVASLNLVNAQGVTFGAKAGLNLENISGVPNTSASMNIGFHIGGIVNIGVNESFSVQPELLYSTAGAKWDQTTTQTFFGVTETIDDNAKYSLSYIQIPILAQYKLDNGLFFQAGPYFGILMGASASETITTTITGQPTQSTSVSSSSDSANNKLDIGLAFGVGYQMPSGLGFSLRYDLGLSSLYKGYSYTDPSSGLTITQPDYGKNGVIQISVHYMFGMGK